MQKSKIEWTDYSINPVKGLCPVGCSYCYARRMYKRFKWNEKITLTSRWDAGLEHIKPSRIFIGSTFELFGGFIPDEWLSDIFLKVKLYPWHTFIFLTKCPQNLPKKFPDHCWVGVSATNNFTYLGDLKNVDAKVKFVSFEPLLKWDMDLIYQRVIFPKIIKDLGVNWIIIGQCTPVKESTKPKIEWIKEIVEFADNANAKVFLKDNLIPMIDELPDNCFTKTLSGDMNLRQEYPELL